MITSEFLGKKYLIFEKLDGYPNLAWAEFIPPWAFLDFFCKISTPVVQPKMGVNIFFAIVKMKLK